MKKFLAKKFGEDNIDYKKALASIEVTNDQGNLRWKIRKVLDREESSKSELSKTNGSATFSRISKIINAPTDIVQNELPV